MSFWFHSIKLILFIKIVHVPHSVSIFYQDYILLYFLIWSLCCLFFFDIRIHSAFHFWYLQILLTEYNPKLSQCHVLQYTIETNWKHGCHWRRSNCSFFFQSTQFIHTSCWLIFSFLWCLAPLSAIFPPPIKLTATIYLKCCWKWR